MRLFPNLVVMAPGDEADVAPMLHFALAHDGPVSIRYPKANLEKVDRAVAPLELGQAEVYEWGDDVMLVAYGTLFPTCVKAAETLRAEGCAVGVINARFVKPLDRETLLKAVDEMPLVVTVEEGTLEGGFGSAVLEAANAAGLDARPTWSAWACRTASSNTASAANCWPTWAWTPTGICAQRAAGDGDGRPAVEVPVCRDRVKK